ncbi:MAG: hypothetical protein LAO56_25415 [Acidobacteriia bacterium]|nr:hypothetical protein [Terriglobia bacterium]
MDDTNGRQRQVTAEQEDMLKRVAQTAATRLSPTEVHALCVLLSIAFGRGTTQSRIFAWHVNAVRRVLGLPQVTQAAAGNPTMEENILQSAVEKLGDEAQAILIQVLLRSPFYTSLQPGASDQQGNNNCGDS